MPSVADRRPWTRLVWNYSGSARHAVHRRKASLNAYEMSLQPSDGALRSQIEVAGQTAEQRLEFYRGEYVLVLSDQAAPPPGSVRANFVRDRDGRVAWFSSGGRLYAHQG